MGRLPFFQKMKVHLDASKQSLHFFRVMWASINVELCKVWHSITIVQSVRYQFPSLLKKVYGICLGHLMPADLLSIEVEKVGDGSINSSTVQLALCPIHPTS